MMHDVLHRHVGGQQHATWLRYVAGTKVATPAIAGEGDSCSPWPSTLADGRLGQAEASLATVASATSHAGVAR
jgi:hypothetical protein